MAIIITVLQVGKMAMMLVHGHMDVADSEIMCFFVFSIAFTLGLCILEVLNK